MDCMYPCPPPSPRACSDSRPLSWWWHPIISSSVVSSSSCPQSFPASGSFPISWLFASGGQSVMASVSTSVLPIDKQGWFPLRLTSLISLLDKGLCLLQHKSLKTSILQCSAFFMVYSHPYRTTRNTIALTIQIFVGKVMPLLFNMLSRFVIAFLPRNKCLLMLVR